jgi:hypothetical protein
MTVSDFAKQEMLKAESKLFNGQIFTALLGYVGITLWLNAIRATAPIFFVWILIILQFVLYCSIFSISYTRTRRLGSKPLSFVFFLMIAILGKVEHWEVVVIPLFILVMLMYSNLSKSK